MDMHVLAVARLHALSLNYRVTILIPCSNIFKVNFGDCYVTKRFKDK